MPVEAEGPTKTVVAKGIFWNAISLLLWLNDIISDIHVSYIKLVKGHTVQAGLIFGFWILPSFLINFLLFADRCFWLPWRLLQVGPLIVHLRTIVEWYKYYSSKDKSKVEEYEKISQKSKTLECVSESAAQLLMQMTFLGVQVIKEKSFENIHWVQYSSIALSLISVIYGIANGFQTIGAIKVAAKRTLTFWGVMFICLWHTIKIPMKILITVLFVYFKGPWTIVCYYFGITIVLFCIGMFGLCLQEPEIFHTHCFAAIMTVVCTLLYMLFYTYILYFTSVVFRGCETLTHFFTYMFLECVVYLIPITIVLYISLDDGLVDYETENIIKGLIGITVCVGVVDVVFGLIFGLYFKCGKSGGMAARNEEPKPEKAEAVADHSLTDISYI